MNTAQQKHFVSDQSTPFKNRLRSLLASLLPIFEQIRMKQAGCVRRRVIESHLLNSIHCVQIWHRGRPQPASGRWGSGDQSLDLIKKFASVQKTHQHGDAPAAPHYPRDDRVPLPERVYFVGVFLMRARVRQFWQKHRYIQRRKESKRPN
ncbi:MAG: hypothetical protein ACJA0W_004079 [Candidatus Azotimanducaceae bacterium]|jgi:hypothetical protein